MLALICIYPLSLGAMVHTGSLEKKGKHFPKKNCKSTVVRERGEVIKDLKKMRKRISI